MKNKVSRITLLAVFGTIIFLYLIGNIFNVPFLYFKIFLNNPLEDGSTQTGDIALLPIAIGLVVGFVVERILKTKEK
ncbi:hypothetical protein [Sporosarcina sp. FA9]|uniref:hypothetical protein n=1 Tax=Sporosarcina sp. FA9 TaxID=3413030 RepID=UPI003F65B191